MGKDAKKISQLILALYIFHGAHIYFAGSLTGDPALTLLKGDPAGTRTQDPAIKGLLLWSFA
jgi:hypothetical protein